MQTGLIADLEAVLADRSIGERALMLRRVTDLFLAGSGTLTAEQVALFDDVMGHLLEQVEISARAAFGYLLAKRPDAPPKVVRTLALDDAIEVAGNLLRHSERLDDECLVEGARTKSQAHLLAISQRRSLSPPVTDVLVERGDRDVALQTAGNPGAAFSEFGYSTLVQRAIDDEELALRVWTRPEIPRLHLLKLFADASEAVKSNLSAKGRHRAESIVEVVTQASQSILAGTRNKSPAFAAARKRVQALYAAGKLGEAELVAFARAGKFDETAVALSLITDVPIALVERAFVDDRPEQLIVIGRSAGLSWETVKSMLGLHVATATSAPVQLDQALETFMRLKVETAKKAMRFYRLRTQAGQPQFH